MRNGTVLLLAVLSMAVASPAFAQRRGKGPALDGEMLAQSCMGCHGTAGASVAGPMPTIGGQNEAYLIEAMKTFKDGSRPSTIMGRLAKAYSEAEIAAMAKYFAGKPFVRVDQKIDPAKAEAGRTPYNKTCKRCHDQGGRESAEPHYPVVAGQWLDAMQVSIEEITAGRRKVDDKFFGKLNELKPAEQDAVLHFFAAQK